MVINLVKGQIGIEEDFVFYGSLKTIDTKDGKSPGDVISGENICKYDLEEDFSTSKDF